MKPTGLETDLTTIFPPEWVKAALVLALISAWVLISLFYYLNRHTRKQYFSLWTVAWMLYSVYLAAAIGLQEHPGVPWLVMARRTCIGMAALFMFWGSFQLANNPRPWRELKLGCVMIGIWSAIAAFMVRDAFWITMPVFALLAGAGVYTSASYFRKRKQYRGATIMAWGFLLWGAHLLLFPLMDRSPVLEAGLYMLSATLALAIAVGMIVEQEVTIAEQSYRQLFDSASDGIFLVDMLSLRVIEVNRAGLRLMQRQRINLVGAHFLEFCPSLGQAGGSVVDNQKLFQAVFKPYTEFKINRADGKLLVCEGELNLVQWHHRSAFQINVRDVTERKQVGQQLQRAEKLSALGQLIAGVAHELNNPLAVVMGYAQVLSRRPGVDDKTSRDILRMQHETERAASIVRDLLSFARPSEPHKTKVNINHLVLNAIESRSADLQAAGVEVVNALAHNLPATKADSHQIEQILSNLVGNAIDAMAGVTSRRALRLTTETNGLFVRVTVADNGDGISTEQITRIFDPFYTTKSPGKGTGLGLTISNTIAQEHRGRLTVESSPGNGAAFHLDLPIVPCDETEPVATTSDACGKPPGQSHRVLLVDDEPGILEVLHDVLTGNGYRVDTASNGIEAMKRLASGQYDLMLSDLRMPDMDGESLYQTVKRQQPHLARRIIFLTGDTVSGASRSFLESTGNRWLSKPFNIREVEQTVRDFLQANTAVVGAN